MKLKQIAAILLLTLSFTSLTFADCTLAGSSYLYPSGYMVPHTDIYSRFFICGGDGIWHEFECPEGLWFNSQIFACDFPWNVPYPGEKI